MIFASLFYKDVFLSRQYKCIPLFSLNASISLYAYKLKFIYRKEVGYFKGVGHPQNLGTLILACCFSIP
jgi:hypothetical protein